MTRKAGRPSENTLENCREKIIQGAVSIIAAQGMEKLTVRAVCRKADISTGTFYHYFPGINYLLMSFIEDISFPTLSLKTPLSRPAARQAELYQILANRYQSFGPEFLYHFYNTRNAALSAYANQIEEKFAPMTIMHRSETELARSKEEGYLGQQIDPHQIAEDLCTLFKGIMFEWCLHPQRGNVDQQISRMFENYFYGL